MILKSMRYLSTPPHFRWRWIWRARGSCWPGRAGAKTLRAPVSWSTWRGQGGASGSSSAALIYADDIKFPSTQGHPRYCCRRSGLNWHTNHDRYAAFIDMHLHLTGLGHEIFLWTWANRWAFTLSTKEGTNWAKSTDYSERDKDWSYKNGLYNIQNAWTLDFNF